LDAVFGVWKDSFKIGCSTGPCVLGSKKHAMKDWHIEVQGRLPEDFEYDERCLLVYYLILI
jgi:hypothetical protein